MDCLSEAIVNKMYVVFEQFETYPTNDSVYLVEALWEVAHHYQYKDFWPNPAVRSVQEMYKGTDMVVDILSITVGNLFGTMTKEKFGPKHDASFEIMSAVRLVFGTCDLDPLIRQHRKLASWDAYFRTVWFRKVFLEKHPDQIDVAAVPVDFAETDTVCARQANEQEGLYNNYRVRDKCVWEEKYEDSERSHQETLRMVMEAIRNKDLQINELQIRLRNATAFHPVVMQS